MKSVVRTLMHNFIETQDRCHTSVSYQETKPTNIEIPMTAPPLWRYDMIGILVTLWQAINSLFGNDYSTVKNAQNTWHAIFLIKKAFIYYVSRSLNRVNINYLESTSIWTSHDTQQTKLACTYTHQKVGNLETRQFATHIPA